MAGEYSSHCNAGSYYIKTHQEMETQLVNIAISLFLYVL